MRVDRVLENMVLGFLVVYLYTIDLLSGFEGLAEKGSRKSQIGKGCFCLR